MTETDPAPNWRRCRPQGSRPPPKPSPWLYRIHISGFAGFATHAPARRPSSGAGVTKSGTGHDGSEDEFHYAGERVFVGLPDTPRFKAWRERLRRREEREQQEAAARDHDKT